VAQIGNAFGMKVIAWSQNLVWGFWCQAFFVVVSSVFYPFQVSMFGWRAVSLPRPESRK
jgi:hypothetical protein